MALIKIEPYIIDSTGNFTFDAVDVTGNLSSLNANLGNLAQASYFTGTLTTNAQPNITSTGTLTSLTVSGTSNLGPVGNVTITGGSSGQYLQTNGSGVLTWATVAGGSSSNISNGNSNVNIPSANGNVNISSAGNANILIVTGTGINVAGTLNVTGDTTVGNITSSGSGGNISNANVISANTLTASGNITANNFIAGNGTGGNISNANVISANTFTASGNITAGNANLGNQASANYFIGNFYGTANSATTATSATTAGTVTTAAQPNITSVGTLSSLAVTGNITSGNANLGNNVSANFFTGNGVYLTGITTAGLSNGNSNVNIPAANGNINFTAVGNTTMVVTGTGVNIAGTLNATGNVSLGNLVTTGSGGNITNANVISANTLTASGTINGADLSLSGNGVFGGNLTVNGTLTYINSTTLSISDPIINLQTGANGAAPTSNSGKDVGTALNYYDTSAKIAWMGWDVSNAEIAFGSNVGISSEVVTFTSLANIRSGNASLGNAASANYFIGNFYGTANSATTAGTVTTAAQPNITSVGTLSGLTGTGTIDFTGASNTSLGPVGNLHITGGTANYVLTTDGAGNLSWAAQSGGNAANVTVDNFTGNGVQTVFTLSTTPPGINQTSVNYNGATVLRTDYTLANANITFSSAPADGSLIEVTTINLTSGGGGGGTSTAAAVGYSLIFGG